MAQIQKLIEKLLSFPKDFTWDELIKILAHFGYKELKTGGGSRRRFVDNEGHVFRLHEPHPGKIVKRYVLNEVVSSLKERRKIEI